MVAWIALAPISIKLENEQLVSNEFTVSRFKEDQLDDLLGKYTKYWPDVYFDLRYKSGYWLKLEIGAGSSQEAWEKLLERAKLFFETLELFKTTFSILAPAGFLVKSKRLEQVKGFSAHFGWENTIIDKPYYSLKISEYAELIDFFSKYMKFWHKNKFAPNSSEYLKRISWARFYYMNSFQTINLRERYISLSIALESLYGEGAGELTYRYANRAALLLGDDITKRKDTFCLVLKAYKKRSKILHGSTKWAIKIKEVLDYTEILRQMILRCISLYSHSYRNIGKALDNSLHDPTEHAKLLEDAKAFFGAVSEQKEIKYPQFT